MTITRSLACVLLFTLSSAPMAAKVYKSVDEQGNVVYTDDPAKGAQPVDLPPLSTYPAPDVRAMQRTEPARDEEESGAGNVYSSLGITSPAPEATVRENTGRVDVRASVSPPLQEADGHRFQFYLDGAPAGDPSAQPQATFHNVPRGEHEVSVAVVDASGNLLKQSEPVTFYLHQQSRNFPFGPKP